MLQFSCYYCNHVLTALPKFKYPARNSRDPTNLKAEFGFVCRTCKAVYDFSIVISQQTPLPLSAIKELENKPT